MINHHEKAQCLLIKFLIEAFQVQFISLYYIIYRLVNSDFLSTVSDSINALEYRNKMRKKEVLVFILGLSGKADPKPIHLVHNQLLLTLLIVAPSYISGLSVFGVLVDHHWQDLEPMDKYFWYLGMIIHILDFIRFIPLIVHIAIVRSYFQIVQYQ